MTTYILLMVEHIWVIIIYTIDTFLKLNFLNYC